MTPSTDRPDRDGLTHILLVEDNPDHAELVMRSFDDRRNEIELHHVTDGAMALGYLRGEGRYADRKAFPAPRLVLLDLRLPKVDGIGVLQAIKGDAKLHQIPVIMLTTSTSVADMRRAYSNHVNSYLKKPLDFPEFHRMMQSFTDYWLAWNQSPV